ncbi:MAG TPA: ABC transporter permease [Lachnospiraceae bacterium]|nr:ABC transporter permease [Lachnospiraceae bacterium]
MRNLIIISKEDFINLLKNPMWIFYATLFPILLVVIMGFLGRESYGENFSSYDYYGIALMLYAILSSGLISANAFMEVRIKKPNMRIIYAPGNVKWIYLSKILASFLFGAFFHLLDMILLCSIYKIHISAIPQIVILFGLTELFSVTLGILLCCIFKTEEMANQLLSIVINLMAIFGGLMFSLDGYGKVIRHISSLSPAKWLLKATFQMIYDGNFTMFLPIVLLLSGLILIMLLFCGLTFKKEDCIC